MNSIAFDDLIKAADVLSLAPAGIQECAVYVKILCTGKTLIFLLSSGIQVEVEVPIIQGAKPEPLPAPFEFFAERALFLPFIRKMRDLAKPKAFQFKHDKAGKTFHLHQGHRRAKYIDLDQPITGHNRINVPSKEKVLPVSDELVAHLNVASKFAANDPSIPQDACIFVSKTHGGIYTKLDQSYFGIETKEALDDFPLPVNLASFWQEGAKIQRSNRGVRISAGNVHIFLQTFEETKEFQIKVIGMTMVSKVGWTRCVEAPNKFFANTGVRLQQYVQEINQPSLKFILVGTSGEKWITAQTVVENRAAFEEKIGLVADAVVKRNFKTEVNLKDLANYCSVLGPEDKVTLWTRTQGEHNICALKSGIYQIMLPQES